MKTLLLFVGLMISSAAFNQVSDTLEAQSFWNDNMLTIIKKDEVKLLDQTVFPIMYGSQKLTKEQFKAKIPTIFTDEIRIELRGSSYKNIDAWVMDGDDSETYMITCFSVSSEYEAMVLMFKKINGIWKLYGIDLHKEG